MASMLGSNSETPGGRTLMSGSDLILEDRGLTDIPIDIALAYGPSAKLLNLKENNLQSVTNIKLFLKLETLILDKNNLTDLSLFPPLPTVKTLWFNNNCVHDLTTFCEALSKIFPNLEYVSLLNNPCCPAFWDETASGTDAYRRYRLLIISKLGKLRFLDATPVLPSEREDAVTRGHFLGTTAKPIQKKQSPAEKKRLQALAYAQEKYEAEKAAKKALRRKSSSSMLGLGSSDARYDGSHSEGNRFITNTDL